MVRHRKPPSQTWRTFVDNHVKTMVSLDFFTVPTIRFQVLYVFLVLAHGRRRILHFAVTAHPTAEWTALQLWKAFRWDTALRYLLRDRDRICGREFVDQIKSMGIKQVLSAPRSEPDAPGTGEGLSSSSPDPIGGHGAGYCDAGSRRPASSLRAPRRIKASSARFHPYWSVPLRRPIDGHRGRGHEAFGEAARGVASRRHRASEVRRRPLKTRKAMEFVRSHVKKVSENDSLVFANDSISADASCCRLGGMFRSQIGHLQKAS